MRWSYVLPAVLGLMLGGGLIAAQEDKPPLASNAAIQYWQAFAQMPALNEENEKILGSWDTVSLADPSVQKLLDSSHSSLMFLHRGAKLEYCDWGLDYQDGISLLLPHLTRARDLARLAALHGRSEMERGNPQGLRQDATSIMTLGRHVGRDPIMICLLVRLGIEGFAIDLVAPHIPDLETPHATAVAAFEKLPPAPALQQIIGAEKELFIRWMSRKLREEEQRKAGAGIKLWKNFIGENAQEALTQVTTAEEAAKQIDAILPIYDDLEKYVALPWSEFQSQYPPFKQRTKEAVPIAGPLLPAIDQLLLKQNRNELRMQMLLAAIAIVEQGPERVKETKDPFGSGPFTYRALDRGFELQSELKYDNKPVTLVFGQRGTK